MPVYMVGRRTRLQDNLSDEVVIEQIRQAGPALGLPSLKAMFPKMPRCRLREIQQKCRRQWRDGHAVVTERLHWLVPGAVWAGDFTELEASIDGCFDYALSTRDLASRMHLLALPTQGEDARIAVPAIEELFRQHGAPLVYKTDNGSAFISVEFRDLLDRWDVIPLLSPPCTPRYNGAAEAGIGSFKTRLFYRAMAHGTEGWTSDDAEAARQQGNHAVQSFGQGRVTTPCHRWQERTPISPSQRQTFRQAVIEYRRQILAQHGLEDEPIEYLSRRDRAASARAAIRRALESLGYLLVTRKRITPPFKALRQLGG